MVSAVFSVHIFNFLRTYKIWQVIKTAPNSLSDGWAKVESEAAAAEQVPPPLLRMGQLDNWLAPEYDL